MSTYRNVKAQIAKLEKQAADLLKKEVAVVSAKVRGLIEEYGLTAADLGLTGKVSKAVKVLRKRKAAAKPAGIPIYADPVSAKTWTGKGKQPNWIVEGLKKGKSKADFLIAKAAPAPATPAKVSKPAMAAKVPKKSAAVSKPAPKVARKTSAKKVSAKAVATKAEVAKD